ncbi:iron chelate uptake ABC transporter family permease subunit [Arthrobacter sp. CAN_C5]|uniref:iron chelate uptake ABC transporter family permease subunit n=1 Tax=Arthrobacter sp. CAN_C5 TaxID=2760706 RepID=UPI0028A7D148|nr:iron chelate uptake ABC transporter family permease subunit [Arthrobacter sp. CAN_C5]MBP2215734.1 iron complex transport system permease protein [Arthrobacter sp. CAN_C5]
MSTNLSTSSLVTARRRRFTRPAMVLVVLCAVALGSIICFLTVGITGSWDFAVPFRARKVAAMVLVAIAVGVSTVLFQTITNNRILTPSIMGFDALYVLIQTVIVFGFGALTLSTFDDRLKWLLEVGAMVLFSTLLFSWLFFGARRSLHLMILVGIILGVLFRSISGFLQRMLDPAAFAVLQDSFFASFNAVNEDLIVISAIAVLVCVLVGARLMSVFDVLGLGEHHSVGLGVNYRRTVLGILVLIAVLVSVSTALVGPITFFGLIVANLAYGLTGTSRHLVVLPATVLLGIIALVGGQFVLEQVFGFNTALSIIIESVGGILFVVLLIRKGPR